MVVWKYSHLYVACRTLPERYEQDWWIGSGILFIFNIWLIIIKDPEWNNLQQHHFPSHGGLLKRWASSWSYAQLTGGISRRQSVSFLRKEALTMQKYKIRLFPGPYGPKVLRIHLLLLIFYKLFYNLTKEDFLFLQGSHSWQFLA